MTPQNKAGDIFSAAPFRRLEGSAPPLGLALLQRQVLQARSASACWSMRGLYLVGLLLLARSAVRAYFS